MLAKCMPGHTDINSNKIFADAALIKTGLVSAIFGAYFGILLDSAFLGGSRESENDTGIVKGFLRITVGFTLLLPFILPYFLLSSKNDMMFLYFFKTTLPFFFLMLFLFSLMKLIYKRLGLLHSL